MTDSTTPTPRAEPIPPAVPLSTQELSILKESLNYTRRAFENYDAYPSYEFKCHRISQVVELQRKLIATAQILIVSGDNAHS